MSYIDVKFAPRFGMQAFQRNRPLRNGPQSRYKYDGQERAYIYLGRYENHKNEPSYSFEHFLEISTFRTLCYRDYFDRTKIRNTTSPSDFYISTLMFILIFFLSSIDWYYRNKILSTLPLFYSQKSIGALRL